MTTLKDLIHNVDFDNVWDHYVHYYPGLVKQKESLTSIFNNLILKKENKNDEFMMIYIDKQESEQEPEGNEIEEFRVHGKNNSSEWSSYWLGYLIENSVLSRFTNEQIVALCLYEMTWFGSTEEEITNKLNNLGEEVD